MKFLTLDQRLRPFQPASSRQRYGSRGRFASTVDAATTRAGHDRTPWRTPMSTTWSGSDGRRLGHRHVDGVGTPEWCVGDDGRHVLVLGGQIADGAEQNGQV